MLFVWEVFIASSGLLSVPSNAVTSVATETRLCRNTLRLMSTRWRGRGCDVVLGRRLESGEDEVQSEVLPRSVGRTGQGWNTHPRYQGQCDGSTETFPIAANQLHCHVVVWSTRCDISMTNHAKTN